MFLLPAESRKAILTKAIVTECEGVRLGVVGWTDRE